MQKSMMPHLIQFAQKWWQDLSLNKKGVIVIALPLAILLASLTSLYLHEQKAAALESKLQLALLNQRDIQTIHTQLLEASNGVRDYLLTGEKDFLANYVLANRKLPLMITELNLQLEDDVQKVRLNRIKPLVDKNLRHLNGLANSNLDAASDTLIQQFNAQSATLDLLRIEIEAMNVNEARLIARDRMAVNIERQRNIKTTLLAALAGILGAILGMLLFSRTIVKRVKLLRDSAGYLARGEALLLPSSSSDELGELAVELDHASQLVAKSVTEAHQARLEAEEASAAKSVFLSRTSHELRTPLNAILGFAQLLELELPYGKHKESAMMINGAGQHLLKLINEVLDIARIESGNMALELVPVGLSDLLDEAVQFIRPLGRIRDIDIQTNYLPNIGVIADRQKLMQVVLNLLSNALKYGPVNSTVYLSATSDEKTVVVEVLDEGAGIPQALQDRLFTPFDRLGAENTKTEGTGLGLALSKQMMLAMQGDINAANNKSLFWISLPATQLNPKLQTHHTPTVHATLDASSKHKILHIEDNASNRALMEAIIARHQGLRLYTVKSIAEALAFLTQVTPELILLDLHLPDGHGETLVKQLKAREAFQHIPILILSADALPSTIARLTALGVTEYFTKPLDVAVFNQRLNTLLQTPSIQ
jgi:signal transduction histidine kinase/ActR/RegA family two-component response regulator